jgi:uncharacterized protein YciI
MEFKYFYIAFLRKGPHWTGTDSPELEALQESHLAHIRSLAEQGKLAIAGPVELFSQGIQSQPDLRGISIFHSEPFNSIDEVKQLVEQDPMVQIGHLSAEYVTWFLDKLVFQDLCVFSIR